MAQTVETGLAGRSTALRIPIRGMHWHLYADPGPFQEEAIPANQRGLLRNWDCLPFVPSGTRRKDDAFRDGNGRETGHSNENHGMKTCALQDCDVKLYGRGLCQKHYLRQWKHGDPLVVLARRGEGSSAAERFWSHVAITADITRCWEWQSYKGSHGYGRFNSAGKSWRAHRFSWMLANGREPSLNILHACDNPGCVNPNHLSEGTQKENITDASRRGRLARKKSPRGNEASCFDRYHSENHPMTLSRVVTSSFLRMLFWKGVVEMATQEFRHYERVWDGLEEFEDAVKAETKLLNR